MRLCAFILRWEEDFIHINIHGPLYEKETQLKFKCSITSKYLPTDRFTRASNGQLNGRIRRTSLWRQNEQASIANTYQLKMFQNYQS